MSDPKKTTLDYLNNWRNAQEKISQLEAENTGLWNLWMAAERKLADTEVELDSMKKAYAGGTRRSASFPTGVHE